MPIEIERKFLVVSDSWKPGDGGTPYRQGYLSTEPARTVRVRLQGQKGKLTIKGEKVESTAPEFEYDIPTEDANFLLDKLCIQPIIEKTRYKVRAADGHDWEIDEFGGVNTGLVIAELELKREEEPFERPAWLGTDVTKDFRYTNARLAEKPFSTWVTSGR
jgi:adenylate cyclase